MFGIFILRNMHTPIQYTDMLLTLNLKIVNSIGDDSTEKSNHILTSL